MSIRAVVRQLGLLLLVLSATILVVAIWSFVQDVVFGDKRERTAVRALIVTVTIGGALGGAMWYGMRQATQTLGRREALLLVAVSWFLAAALVALPYYLWSHWDRVGATTPFAHFVDCYFEAMSGLTTTGSTVLSRIGELPPSLVLWRATTQWIGGGGIIVLFVAVLPIMGVGGKNLFRMEASHPTPEGVAPRIQDTARVLWIVYLCLTAAEVIALFLCGMGLFDAVCHAFTTIATGGFSPYDASIGAFHSASIDFVLLIFMFASGVNFGLYYQCTRRGWRSLVNDPEFRCYTALLVGGSAVVALSLVGREVVTTAGQTEVVGLTDAVRYGAFQAVSLQTTTGYCTADFDQWGFLAKAVMVVMILIGGSAGSTSGGLKVIRLVSGIKIAWAQLEHVFRPQAVRPVKLGRAILDKEMTLTTLVFILSVILLLALGSGAMMLFDGETQVDATTAITANITCFSNTGPGLALVGATQNFGWIASPGKIVLCIVMALGRLEVFTIVVLFYPRFWRDD